MILTQNLIHGKDYPSKLEWFSYDKPHDFNLSVRKALGGGASAASSPSPVGLATLLPKNGVLEGLALCVGHRIYVLRTKSGNLAKSRSTLKDDKLLLSIFPRLVGIGMARLALHIKHRLGYHVKGYEVFDGCAVRMEVDSPGQAVYAFVDPTSDSFRIDRVWDIIPSKANAEALENLCLRAWITMIIAKQPTWDSRSRMPADTTKIKEIHLSCIFRMMQEVHMVEAAKPRTNENDFSKVGVSKKSGQLVIHNDRFKTRVRDSKKTKVELTLEDKSVHHGRVKGVDGKKTFINSKANVASEVTKVRVIGREELTSAEEAREDLILRILQGEEAMESPDVPFISRVWFPRGNKANLGKVKGAKLREGRNNHTLNQSQSNVVEAMLNSKASIIVVHGPPGTGKTSTISVAIREWLALRKPAWAVAQSNVGVKNIAESLAKHGVPFRLLVSKEFYFEWHEQIYEEVESQLIRTDKLPKDPREMDLLFHNIKVILCTLGTLSNPKLQEKRVFELVPVENLVVDEASQIGVVNYLHIFSQFNKLKKVCFFGDPKQLPPFGQDAAPKLQSIFDFKHLQSQSYFLDTQYRMPTPLGSFISRSVYQSKLKSIHKFTSRACVKFVDVCGGKEARQGCSWKNEKEVQTVVRLVQMYYKNQEYCIITPYDAQRNAIAKALKAEKLPHDNVFNVDSFQGNEADHVIVSVARTRSPGFLKSRNRVNVMLTRCKIGMVIVTDRTFAENQAQETLLGELVAHWASGNTKADAWIDWKDVINGKANLPVRQEAGPALEAKLASLTVASA